MMEIKIETSCEEDLTRVSWYITKFCKENFRQSKVFVDGKPIHEHDWRGEDEKTREK